MERCVCARVILWEVQGQGFTLYISEIDSFLPSKVRCACPGSDFRNVVDSICFLGFVCSIRQNLVLVYHNVNLQVTNVPT